MTTMPTDGEDWNMIERDTDAVVKEEETKQEAKEEAPEEVKKEKEEGKQESKKKKTAKVAFICDATGSMKQYLDGAKECIEAAIDSFNESDIDVEQSVIVYRDHKPQDMTFVAKGHPFGTSRDRLVELLHKTTATGGGDGPEAVGGAALQFALSLDWGSPNAEAGADGADGADATGAADDAEGDDVWRVAFLIADAPPHGVDLTFDGFPNGTPANFEVDTLIEPEPGAEPTKITMALEGRDLQDVLREFSDRKIELWTMCAGHIFRGYRNAAPWMVHAAAMTGGRALYLPNDQTIAQELTRIMCASVSEAASDIDIERRFDAAKRTMTRLDAEGNRIGPTDEEVSQHVAKEMRAAGVHSSSMSSDVVDDEAYSKLAKAEPQKVRGATTAELIALFKEHNVGDDGGIAIVAPDGTRSRVVPPPVKRMHGGGAELVPGPDDGEVPLYRGLAAGVDGDDGIPPPMCERTATQSIDAEASEDHVLRSVRKRKSGMATK